MKWWLIITKLDFGCYKYKIKVMVEFSDQLSQNNWYITLTTKVLVTYIIRF